MMMTTVIDVVRPASVPVVNTAVVATKEVVAVVAAPDPEVVANAAVVVECLIISSTYNHCHLFKEANACMQELTNNLALPPSVLER